MGGPCVKGQCNEGLTCRNNLCEPPGPFPAPTCKSLCLPSYAEGPDAYNICMKNCTGGLIPSPYLAACQNVGKCGKGEKEYSNNIRAMQTGAMVIGLILLFMALFRCLKVIAYNANKQ